MSTGKERVSKKRKDTAQSDGSGGGGGGGASSGWVSFPFNLPNSTPGAGAAATPSETDRDGDSKMAGETQQDNETKLLAADGNLFRALSALTSSLTRPETMMAACQAFAGALEARAKFGLIPRTDREFLYSQFVQWIDADRATPPPVFKYTGAVEIGLLRQICSLLWSVNSVGVQSEEKTVRLFELLPRLVFLRPVRDTGHRAIYFGRFQPPAQDPEPEEEKQIEFDQLAHCVHDQKVAIDILTAACNTKTIELRGQQSRDYKGSPLIWFGVVPKETPEIKTPKNPWDPPKSSSDAFLDDKSRYGPLRIKISADAAFYDRHPYALGSRKVNSEWPQTVLMVHKTDTIIFDVPMYKKTETFPFQLQEQAPHTWNTRHYVTVSSSNDSDWVGWDHPEIVFAAATMPLSAKHKVQIDFVDHIDGPCPKARSKDIRKDKSPCRCTAQQMAEAVATVLPYDDLCNIRDLFESKAWERLTGIFAKRQSSSVDAAGGGVKEMKAAKPKSGVGSSAAAPAAAPAEAPSASAKASRPAAAKPAPKSPRR